MKHLVQPQGPLGAFADILLEPAMYLLQGTIWERPQRTHVWNNVKLPRSVIAHLNLADTVTVPGDPTANPALMAGCIPRFHMPLFGGWRRFVVLTADDWSAAEVPWHIGWFSQNGGAVGISRISLTTPVRMTIGPGETTFFAVNGQDQLLLRKLGFGRIGEAGKYRHLPLL